MDFGRYLGIAITVVAFMFGLWVLLQVLGVVTSGLNTATNQIVATVSTTAPPTIYAFQPTNPSISSKNAQGYLVQLPKCSISSNPHGEATGTYGLLNCVAIEYGAISVVVWFYEPPGGQGIIIAFQGSPYPSTSVAGWVPWLYIGTDGILRLVDTSISVSMSNTLAPGWHMVVAEEWSASLGSGPYFMALYLDGQLVAQTSTSTISSIFGGSNSYPYSNIGTGFSAGNYPSGNGGWFFFNGTIAYVAVYNTVLSQSQVQALYQAGFPNTLYSDNLVAAYYLSPNYYSDSEYFFVPFFVNSQIMSQMGISNADATSITPSGSVGAIPSSQFVPFKDLIIGGAVYTINNATGMDASAIFSPVINYAQDFASVFAIVIIIGLVVGFIWTKRR